MRGENTMDYIIRKMKKSDCKDIAHVVTVAWNETYKGIVPDEFLNNLYKNEEQRATNSFKNFDEKNNNQFVLEVCNKVVGFVNVGITDDISYSKCGEIYSLYIINGYKGYGYGKKLMKVGVNELREIGCSKMLIGCLQGNPSNEFYKHIGGKFIKTRVFQKLNLIENVYFFEDIISMG